MATVFESCRRPAIAGVLAFGTLALLAACSSDEFRDPAVIATSAGEVDLTRYAGKWYEIARFPNSFQRGCTDVTAEYALRDDGDVDVLNTCQRDGKTVTADAIATSVSPGNDRLLVDFVSWLPFTNGDYWVLDVTDDYAVAIVGAPTGSNGWILSRNPKLSPEARTQAETVLARNGYDTAGLVDTPQSGG